MPSKRTNPSVERLRQARIEAGLTQEQVAERAGLTRTSVSRYETAIAPPSELALNMLAKIYERPVEWFYSKEEEPQAHAERPNAEESVSTTQSTAELQRLINSLNEIRRDFESFARSRAIADSGAEYNSSSNESKVRSVEVVEVAAAAGGGALVFDETEIGHLWFRHDWLQHNAIDPQQCNVITVRGESMEPTLPDGCHILVDRSQNGRRRREGRIYVMRTEDGLVVKHARRDDEGQWQIVSENPAWPPVPWSRETEIIGEVRWYGVTVGVTV